MDLRTRWSKKSRVQDRIGSDDAIDGTIGNGRVVVGQVQR